MPLRVRCRSRFADGSVALHPRDVSVTVHAAAGAAPESGSGMDADDEDFLVIRAVEDADAPALGQAIVVCARESRGPSSFSARVLEAVYLAALRVHARHHVLDDAVLAGRIKRLKDEEQRVGVGRVQAILQLAQLAFLALEPVLISSFPR